MKNEIPSLVKWAGGKKQLIEQFKPFFPSEIKRYFEPFVGGGAVAFYIIKEYDPAYVLLSDINEELINVYNVIKHSTNELILLLKQHKLKHNKEYYYQTRKESPVGLTPIERAGRFIYLNKTCFNGLYRVNSKGGFNVPMGKYVNPGICPENDLIEISNLLKKVNITVMHFDKVLDYAKGGDFVYFDPPYYPLNKTSSFTTYTKDNFLEKEQELLSEVFKKLDKKGCRVMLSNSDTEFIKNLYKGFNIATVKATRMINCDATKRNAINELVVTNYSNGSGNPK